MLTTLNDSQGYFFAGSGKKKTWLAWKGVISMVYLVWHILFNIMKTHESYENENKPEWCYHQLWRIYFLNDDRPPTQKILCSRKCFWRRKMRNLKLRRSLFLLRTIGTIPYIFQCNHGSTFNATWNLISNYWLVVLRYWYHIAVLLHRSDFLH